MTGALLATGTALALRGGGAEYYRSLHPKGVTPKNLSEKAFATLCVFCQRVLPAKDPADPARPDALEARIAERIDLEIAFHTPKMQRDLELALLWLEHGALLHFSTTRFTHLSPERQDALLQKMAGGIEYERQVFTALKMLAVFFFYSDERSWKGIGYDGPPGTARKRPPADSKPQV